MLFQCCNLILQDIYQAIAIFAFVSIYNIASVAFQLQDRYIV